ncbi:hypothetical protein FRC12_018033 [Ceratobasidium sp. 428]|nr:hypothetical protein FRC12_018033 [Ceratobasidium sp. 428]
MVFARFQSLILCLLLTVNPVQVVLGWAFGPPNRVQEGASATFRVLDNGDGFWYPYTMTAFKKVPNVPNEQVGLVFTNESTFYWDCNQPAGTVLQFRLVSKANVNAAYSDDMVVQTGAEAIASSISVQSVASTASLFSKTATQGAQATQTGNNAGELEPKFEKAKVSASMVAGVGVAAVVLLVILPLVAWWLYRRRRNSKVTPEVIRPEDTITPFMRSQSHQHMLSAGNMGNYPSPDEEPPQYVPPSTATYTWDSSNLSSYPSTYASTSEPSETSRVDGIPVQGGAYAPARGGKQRRS